MSSVIDILRHIVDFHRGGFTPFSAAWTLLGVIGGIVTAYNLRDAIQDTEALVELPPVVSDERRHELVLIARASIRQEVLRLIKMASIITTGLVVSLTAPVISDAQRAKLHVPYWTTPGIVFIIGLFVIVGIIVLQAILDRKVRRTFYKREVRGKRRNGGKVTTVTVVVPNGKGADTKEHNG